MSPFNFHRPSFFSLWPDWVLVGAVLALSGLGIVTIWGASATEGVPLVFGGFAKRQLMWACIGLALMAGLSFMDYRWTRSFAWVFFFALLTSLGLLALFGEKIHGAASWHRISIGSFNFSVQPSEFGKIAVVILLARYLASRAGRFSRFHHTIVPLVLLGLPVGLIFLQPDFGTAVVYLPAAFVMFYIAGIRKRVLVFYALLGIGAAIAIYPTLKPYQKARVQTFLDPSADALGKGYNVIQAQTALGSGRLFGKGWGKGTQTSFRFLPEYETDFVFPSLGEQFGLVGCLAVLLLYTILLWRMLAIAARAPDLFGTLMIAGLVSILTVHLILNIGMTTGLLPVTGVPLPFFSYGGSFMLTCFAMAGLSSSVSVRRQ